MKNNCDRHVFKKDLEKLLNSKYTKDRTVLVDSRVLDFDFEVPRHKKIVHASPEKCLELLKSKTREFICLTVGTSYGFPSIGDREWVHYLRGQFQYPALRGYRGVFLAEIHCYCYNWFYEPMTIGQYYRISVYKIDGLRETRARLTRFENQKEIDEGYLKLGENLEDEVMAIDNFSGPGEYDYALNAEGQGIGGTAVKWSISRKMSKYNLSFPEAWRFLEEKGSLIWVEKEKKAHR